MQTGFHGAVLEQKVTFCWGSSEYVVLYLRFSELV
jgi:hypothetical protein